MTRQTTIIQNIHAPVYGHVAGGDIHAATEAHRQLLPLHFVEGQLRSVRWRLFRERVGWWINLPTLLALAWMAFAGNLALGSLATWAQPDEGANWVTFAALVLPIAGLVAWLLYTRRIRGYRIAQLEREAVELESQVTLRRAGLL
ncbi:hypothetical protein CKO44_15980 [Rubrivivax gelatinosus]|uniref:hypothetical protein n=1 Tax=Rubrivivax gelatinosus TaxID=28068 RepID=UPI001905F6FE|nr:hypothetical protein [Rubrivivax gelatinosus]MBK1614968.1 hypothetical protein [Rubrivivax gelatinosus]MBZ8143425.1 hypothetical protein [Rubrivivax gelatinosus]